MGELEPVSRRPRRKLDAAALEEMARLFADGWSAYAIGEKFGVSRTTVDHHARYRNWVRTVPTRITRTIRISAAPSPAHVVGRVRIVRRMMAAFEQQIAALEARFADGAGEAALDEPGVKMLGALAKTFETLIALDRAARDGARSRARPTGDGSAGDPDDRAAEGETGGAGDRDRLRQEIAERLSKLLG